MTLNSQEESSNQEKFSMLTYPLDLSSDHEGFAVQFRIWDVQSDKISSSKKDFTPDKFNVAANNLGTGVRGIQAIAGAVGVAGVAASGLQIAAGAKNLSSGLSSKNVSQVSSSLQSLKSGGFGVLKSTAVAGSIAASAGAVASTLKETKGYENNVGNVFLYIPAKIDSSHQFNWEMQDFSLLNAINQAISGDLSGTLANIASGGLTGDPKLMEYIGREFGAGTIEALLSKKSGIGGFNVQSAIEAATKTVRNPYVQFLFKQVSPRNFTYGFTFAPKDKKEEEVVEQIIHKFRYFSHPGVSANSNLYMTYPAVFEISFLANFKNGTGQKILFKTGKCACTNILVDYTGHGEGYAGRMETGKPVQINMQIAFQELQLLTRENIARGF